MHWHGCENFKRHPREQEDGFLLSLWFLKFVVSRVLGPLTGRDSLVFLSGAPIVEKS